MIPFMSSLVAVGGEAPGRWLHACCKPLSISKTGPFVVQADGSLMTVDGNVLATSGDDGKTWKPISGSIHSGIRMGGGGHPGQIVRTTGGTIVIVYLDFDGYKFSWDNAAGAPKADCKLEMWCVRSTDGGKTWVDRQRLLAGYSADFMGFIQTSKGSLVVTVEHLSPELRRWVCCSFVSTDEGKTWRQGNLIDLGGHGHHDGAVEPMVAELGDGRLLMLIRTNLDRFWQAWSEDGGRYWRTIRPSELDASSSPGWLLRLKSGRLAVVWNRVKPEGRDSYPRVNHTGPASEFPASWHREELSLAFSSDDGATWTRPVVIARQPGGKLCYPYMLERRAGELWITTHGHKPGPALAVRIMEQEFLTAASRN
ncbi:MAG: exo-alpha-sialidase [Phycisphaerae bacterium]|nr:exo-alpha-sialidase [Phycisphaerae bacterium]